MADYVCLSENELRLEARQKSAELQDTIRFVSDKIGCQKIMVTRGKLGSEALFSKEFASYPALTDSFVDRVGAGDAVFAITSLLAYQGASAEECCFVGNVVGAQKVGVVGNRIAVDKNLVEQTVIKVLGQ